MLYIPWLFVAKFSLVFISSYNIWLITDSEFPDGTAWAKRQLPMRKMRTLNRISCITSPTLQMGWVFIWYTSRYTISVWFNPGSPPIPVCHAYLIATIRVRIFCLCILSYKTDPKLSIVKFHLGMMNWIKNFKNNGWIWFTSRNVLGLS